MVGDGWGLPGTRTRPPIKCNPRSLSLNLIAGLVGFNSVAIIQKGQLQNP